MFNLRTALITIFQDANTSDACRAQRVERIGCNCCCYQASYFGRRYSRSSWFISGVKGDLLWREPKGAADYR